jgi:DNA-binding SARP family transcriptional activator/tetratricopeptide (TPR) repeat protein
MARQTAGMEFGLLGPLMVRCGATVLPVPPGNQRALLAALLLDANQSVALGKIAETLWGAEPPPSAPATIRNYVRRLRQAMGAAGHARISTEPGGYMISVGAGELDVSRFEVLLGSAREAAGDGCWDRAAGQARAALELWRGEPLADVDSDVLALREVPRLSEMRLRALETRIDAELHLGRHAEVVGDLQSLAAAHPLRESLHAMLMLALYRCGRQADALATYQHARTALVEDLGIEPGSELRQLHQRILSAEPGLAAPGSAESAGTPEIVVPRVREPGRAGPDGHMVVPHMLPGAVPHFTGRAAELAKLSGVLDQAGRHASGTVVISAIGGTAGVGKTALAVHWAHRVADRFPDGQLYVNLCGFDPAGTPVRPAEAVRGLLNVLGVPADRIPADLAAQAGLYRSQLAGRRMLIVLDNARDEPQVRPLLPAGTACLVIVTSRSRLAGLAAVEGACLVNLDVLPPAEARQMLISRLGPERAAPEPAAVTEITELCARLPLALAVAAGRAAARTGLPLSALADELRDARARLDALDTGDPAASLRAVFSWSCYQLSPAAAQMFRLLGLHPGPAITVLAAASLAGVPPPHARQALGELTRAHLVGEQYPGRYAFHDLLRAYAAEQAHHTDSDIDRHEATGRVLDHYLHTAAHAGLLLHPATEPVVLAPPKPGAAAGQPADRRQAMVWFEAEHQVLLAALALAAGSGFDTHAWQLSWAMAAFLQIRGHWQEWAATQRTAMAAATRLGDAAAQALSGRLLANACTKLGDHDQARGHFASSLALYQQLGNRLGEAKIHQGLSVLADGQGRYADALGHAEQALRLYQAIGDKANEADALNDVGWDYGLLGDYQQARAFCWQALNLCAEAGLRWLEGAAWDSVGYAERHLGNLAEAAACYQRALGLYRDAGERFYEADTLTHLGDTRHAAGELVQARDAWQQALAILDDLQHPDADQVRAKLTSADGSAHASG